jgi:hypothetical protein
MAPSSDRQAGFSKSVSNLLGYGSVGISKFHTGLDQYHRLLYGKFPVEEVRNELQLRWQHIPSSQGEILRTLVHYARNVGPLGSCRSDYEMSIAFVREIPTEDGLTALGDILVGRLPWELASSANPIYSLINAKLRDAAVTQLKRIALHAEYLATRVNALYALKVVNSADDILGRSKLLRAINRLGLVGDSRGGDCDYRGLLHNLEELYSFTSSYSEKVLLICASRTTLVEGYANGSQSATVGLNWLTSKTVYSAELVRQTALAVKCAQSPDQRATDIVRVMLNNSGLRRHYQMLNSVLADFE